MDPIWIDEAEWSIYIQHYDDHTVVSCQALINDFEKEGNYREAIETKINKAIDEYFAIFNQTKKADN